MRPNWCPLLHGNFSPNSLVYGYAGNTGAGALGGLIRASDRGSFEIGQNGELVCTDMAPLPGASLAYCENLAGTPNLSRVTTRPPRAHALYSPGWSNFVGFTMAISAPSSLARATKSAVPPGPSPCPFSSHTRSA